MIPTFLQEKREDFWWQMRIVIKIADTHIEPVTSIAVVAGPVDIGIVTRPGFGIVSRPGIIGQTRWLIKTPIGVEGEHLGATIGLRGGGDDLDHPVAI